MRNFYIDAKLDYISLPVSEKPPENRIFSQARPWLLLTPCRLERLALMLGLADPRVDALVRVVRRHAPDASEFCRRLGCPPPPEVGEEYPIAICPICDSVHRPHPDDRELACPECRRRAEERQARQPSPKVLKDRAEDQAARRTIQENDPEAFRDGVLSPNWKINESRRLERDWDRAVNRIVMGGSYRKVAREFECSVGLLHRKVKENRPWDDN